MLNKPPTTVLYESFVCSGIGYGKICWREICFDRFSDAERTLFYGIRTQPSKSAGTRLPQQIAMITHMGGPPITVDLEALMGVRADEWQVTIVSPGLAAQDLQSLHLSDSQGIFAGAYLSHVRDSLSPMVRFMCES